MDEGRQSAHCTQGCGLGRRRSGDGVRGKVSEPVCGDGSGERENKNPEVMLFLHLNQQFALDPCRPVFAGCLRTQRTILTWAPGLLPTGFGRNASGSYLAFGLFLVLSTGGSLSTVTVPLLPLRCRRGTVNSLRSRTRHQSENLGNCQRTIVFLLLSCTKSIKIQRLYLICFQLSAARPQAHDRKWCNCCRVSRSGVLKRNIFAESHAPFDCGAH